MSTSKLRIFALQSFKRTSGENTAKKKPRQCYLEYESLTRLENTGISSYNA